MYNQDANYIDKPEIETLTTFGQNQKVHFSTPSELYDAVYENAFHPMYMGTDDGHIFKFNKKFSQILAYSEIEMMQKEGFQIFDVNEKAFRDFLNERNEKGIANADVTCIRKSGERFPCRISSVVYETNQGKKRTLNTVIALSKIINTMYFLESSAAKDK